MERPYSHTDPSPPRTGEWDTPTNRRSTRSDWTATSSVSTRGGGSRAGELVRASDIKPVLSNLKQEVLPEDEYIEHLSAIIKRDFFPHLQTLETRNEVLAALESEDLERIEESTPLTTSSTPAARPSSSHAAPASSRIDPSLSLDAFQSRYTSEDNSSFQDLLVVDNQQRRDKHAWAWEAEKKANVKAVRGRQARERLVDVTKRMIESSGDGTVRLLDGPAGKPGEKRLLVDEGVEVGTSERLMIKGRDEKERLLITDGKGATESSIKGKAREVVDERAKQFVDWDKPTVEEDEAAEPIPEDELQIQTSTWPFKNRNSLMFPPDADRNNPSSIPPDAPTASSSASTSRSGNAQPVLVGEPKGIRYHATRMAEIERGRRGGASDASSDISASPSRSRIGAAIAGTPYPAPPASQTPRVSGFSFVDALPSHSSSSLPAQALQELMTWGTIEATPVTLRTSGDDMSVGPFRVREADRREELAHKMARKAKRSLADSGREGVAAGGGGGSTSLRRSAMEASVKGGATPGGVTPRRSATDLSPAARSLLGRTKPGKALEGGLAREKQWSEDEERRRLERARQRAREVESRDRLRRERWTLRVQINASRAVSVWANVPAGPPDPILGITEAFKRDTDPKKINLGVGAYRDADGKPYVLPSVLAAEDKVIGERKDKEYLPITGLGEFTKAAAVLAYGEDSKPLKEGRVAITQSLSGTGALRIAGAFLARHYPHSKTIYLPAPTWGNHIPIFKDSGLEVKTYSYYDKNTVGLDFEGLKKDLQAAPNKSIVLLHACAHNPTGIDPTQEQWREISQLIKEKEHFPLIDNAYLGFASGSVDNDAFMLRHFVEQGHQLVLCQSFAKNMGLYGERVGTFSVVCADPEEKARVDSQIKILVRPMYSNPPVHGARVASTLLTDPKLNAQWLAEVKGMADRIIDMRSTLYDLLKELGSKREWGHIKNQIGMFAYLGISPEQVDRLAKEHHVYLTRDGRISVAGITKHNVRHLAESLHEVTKNDA
ncbi:Aspartate aminotransferase [Rhodotorula toruloides ATCC 204091]|nr:Aspartate aminotransferase [Rhodotorula toruloides ATCC 204091]